MSIRKMMVTITVKKRKKKVMLQNLVSNALKYAPHGKVLVGVRRRDGQVAIEAGAGDDAQASEAVEATLTGPEIEVAFNPGFLIDGLGAMNTAFTRLSFTQPTRAAMLTGQAELDGEPDATYRYVLLPVRYAS